ncbi:A/G-specific adenine glycosylase [Alteribacillus sp. JSM 102045]|uniref:A/G-specific adenine glycosylase n=1 Tax=Alteribacillus sp. JSM 102045 TaxID=1562101 RepID=UPI0035C12455
MELQLEKINVNEFQNDLISWYEHNKRDLPWRKTQDPYRVWVSEIMLQQTKVDTVIPYFNRFLEWFPTPEALAEADEEKVMKAWEGLGYYSRARNLQSAIKEVVEEYGGEVPASKKEFSSLKGVGPYTAGAVLSIAFDQAEPAVDGNVMRVFSRILLINEDIGKSKTRKMFEDIIPEFLEGVQPSQFNQALMELGAIVCTPKSPGCLLCPVQKHCAAREEGIQEELPVKEKKKAPKSKDMAAVILKNKDGQTLFHQRGEKGLLARLWEYPNVEIPSTSGTSAHETLQHFLKKEFGIDAEIEHKVQKVQHVFSHLVWNITVYEAKALQSSKEINDCKWLYPNETDAYAFPVSHQKILEAHKEKGDIEWN